MKVIIQIPCFNEADTLQRVIDDLPTCLSGVDCIERLIIDDGSKDGTSDVAKQLGIEHIARHNRNRGLAAAFSTGLEMALNVGADIVVNTDGDHQYPGRYIEQLVAPIVEGRSDIVIGDRKPGSDRKFSMVKRALQRLGRWTISRLAGSDLPDPASGFREISREAAIRTHIVTGYSYTIESLLQAVHKGLAVEFVDIETNPATRRSRLFRNIPHFLARSATTILRVFFMYHPLHILVWLSGLLAFVGLFAIARFVLFYLSGNGQGHLQSVVLGGVLVVMAGLSS